MACGECAGPASLNFRKNQGREKMKTKQIFIIVALIGCLLSAISQMYAQSDRTFVSSAGIDSSTCGSQASPCRSFNVAIPNTNSGGEVIALDSGIYDTFN